MTQSPISLTRETVLSQLETADPFPIDFDDAWVWLGFGSKYDAKVSLKSAGFVENVDYWSFQESSGKPQGGRPSEKIRLTTDCFKMWGMAAHTKRGHEVRVWYVGIEKEWRQMTRFNALPTSRIIGIKRERDNLEVENRILRMRSEFALSPTKTYARVTADEHTAIRVLRSQGFSMASIARSLKRSPSTVRRHAI
jgi:phage anti-repressor protein